MAQSSAEMAKRAEHVPLSNLNYDLLTVLQNKLEAVAAYEIYLKDCQQSGDKECQTWWRSSNATMNGMSSGCAPSSSGSCAQASSTRLHV